MRRRNGRLFRLSRGIVRDDDEACDGVQAAYASTNGASITTPFFRRCALSSTTTMSSRAWVRTNEQRDLVEFFEVALIRRRSAPARESGGPLTSHT